MGQQDSRYFVINKFDRWLFFQVFVCLLNICGLFFLGGLLSKHEILNFFFISRIGFFLVIFFLIIISLSFF